MAKRPSATIKKIAKLMRDVDFCMLTTHTKGGGVRARPMSNNGEEGPESDDIVLIKVTPTVVSYWTKKDEGELRIK